MIFGEHELAAGAKGIMFTEHSVQQIGAGAKTQTRRLMTAGAVLVDGWGWTRAAFAQLMRPEALAIAWTDNGPSPAGNPGPYLKVPDRPEGGTVHRVYPRYFPGDRWYVKEGWGVAGAWAVDPCLTYRALNDEGERDQQPIDPRFAIDVQASSIDDAMRGKRRGMTWRKGWRSPILMPRWAARYFLEVTQVRIQRLHQIDHADLVAEGMAHALDRLHDEYDNVAPPGETTWPTLRELYEHAWDTMHKAPGTTWADNPWVIVYDFKRLTTDG